jgi:hypothetical protein
VRKLKNLIRQRTHFEYAIPQVLLKIFPGREHLRPLKVLSEKPAIPERCSVPFHRRL